jgi:hypothetical protein
VNLSLICACNDEDVLRKNLMASSLAKKCEVIVERDYTNVPKAYNAGMQRASGDIWIFAHQDVFLPDTFEGELRTALFMLGREDWGVIGPAGQSASGGHGYVLDRGMAWGQHRKLPIEVDTLDELMLIVKRDTLFKFDEDMPNHHLIGTDLCMQARARNKVRYAIRAYCAHNSKTRGIDPSFWDAADYVMRKWPQFLPIYATVADLRGLDAPRITRP